MCVCVVRGRGGEREREREIQRYGESVRVREEYGGCGERVHLSAYGAIEKVKDNTLILTR